ncbi:hypothetical protein PTSG_12386 [Salpingoeca rosetta]|uniref:Integrase catalytic domain-containing protein n=1 Tax=Salpingoeca rosetta (strain ATCC 50818 / BSB-021) TaxID=946362 RepID=F2UDI7_SALR5|nr:uncharacterized protein PTSG_12386 [Salpingoeca rosetta]EGD74682.1 hypothetical protein PTSG_12386 [Salpingoeca rosetta]|eukprot:XP_004992939.1 hypothetical protein PTSG_12386 [Salpingoeca rosetta]
MNQFKHQDNPMGKVPVFNGVNMRYSVWAMRVRNYMLERDCWLAVSEGDNDEEYERMIRSLSESQQAQYRQMYGRAMGIIGNAVGGALTKIVSGPTIRGDPRKAWFALKQLYDRRDDEEISRLSASIFARTWGKDDNVQTVMGDVIDAYDEITAAQGVLSESMVVNHVLNILPDKYRNVAQIIRVTQRQLDLRELLKMLLLEQARARTKTQSQHQPLIAYAQKGDARKDKRRCWNCDKPGHLSKDCRSRKKKTPGHGRKPRRDQDRTRQYRHEKTFKLAETAHVTSTAAAGDNGWLVDSGATTHVSSVRDDFLTLSEESVDVTLADGSTVTATGRGTVRLQTSAGAVTMTDVLYLPRGQARIISMGKIMEKGNDVYSKAGSLYITFPDRTQIQLQKRDELYFLPQTTTSATTAAAVQENTATSATTATAIHENMGHRACDPCIKGKMRNANSKKFSGNSNNSYKPGEMLCADLTGPHPPTLTGGRFAVVLLDVATQYSSVGLMATKKDLANTLDSMLMTLPRAMGIGHRVNTLKTDNEPLFSTPAMLKVLHKHKLDMRHSPPYRPEKNGDVERHIQTLTSTARTLLIDARLPTEFWGCALLHASHVHNHLKPLQRLKLHPVVQDMKQFGVTAYVRDRNGDKWRPRTWTGIYVGFNPQCRAHKIYNPESHNVISTYDVRFLTMEESWLRPVLHQREDFLPPSLDLAQRPLPSTTTTTTHEPVMTQQQQTHEPVMTQQQRMHQPVQIQRQPQREKQKQARRVRKQPQQQTTHRKQTSPVQSLPPQQTTPVQALPPQQTTPVQSLPPQQTSVQTLPTQHKQASEPPQQLTQTTQPPQQVQHMTQPPQQVQHMTPTTSDQGPRRSARIRAQQQKTTAAKATAAQARAGFEEAERSEMDSLRRHGVLERVEEKGCCGYDTTAQLSDLEKGQQFPTAQIVTYVDASFAMDAGRRSRSGIVICVNNMPVYWRSSKQTITALSAAEAEYSAITEGIKHTIHVRDQLDEMMIKHSTPVILTDSMSAIHMANSDKIQERTKHLGIRMQFTRDHVRKQTVELQHVPSGDQVADMLTKPLHKGAFHRLVQKIMHHE